MPIVGSELSHGGGSGGEADDGKEFQYFRMAWKALHSIIL